MTWQIDTAHTSVSFSVKHMMVANARGRFDIKEATVEIDEANPENSKVTALIDAASVDTREAQRDQHLRSADFFDVEHYPYLKFESTRVAVDGGDIAITGDLTIKDVTREIVLKGEFEGPITDAWGNRRAGFDVEATIEREDFGLTWNVVAETGGLLVGKKVKIRIETEVVEPAAVVVGDAEAVTA